MQAVGQPRFGKRGQRRGGAGHIAQRQPVPAPAVGAQEGADGRDGARLVVRQHEVLVVGIAGAGKFQRPPTEHVGAAHERCETADRRALAHH
jgi:hypothetical protein